MGGGHVDMVHSDIDRPGKGAVIEQTDTRLGDRGRRKQRVEQEGEARLHFLALIKGPCARNASAASMIALVFSVTDVLVFPSIS